MPAQGQLQPTVEVVCEPSTVQFIGRSSKTISCIVHNTSQWTEEVEISYEISDVFSAISSEKITIEADEEYPINTLLNPSDVPSGEYVFKISAEVTDILIGSVLIPINQTTTPVEDDVTLVVPLTPVFTAAGESGRTRIPLNEGATQNYTINVQNQAPDGDTFRIKIVDVESHVEAGIIIRMANKGGEMDDVNEIEMFLEPDASGTAIIHLEAPKISVDEERTIRIEITSMTDESGQSGEQQPLPKVVEFRVDMIRPEGVGFSSITGEDGSIAAISMIAAGAVIGVSILLFIIVKISSRGRRRTAISSADLEDLEDEFYDLESELGML